MCKANVHALIKRNRNEPMVERCTDLDERNDQIASDEEAEAPVSSLRTCTAATGAPFPVALSSAGLRLKEPKSAANRISQNVTNAKKRQKR